MQSADVVEPILNMQGPSVGAKARRLPRQDAPTAKGRRHACSFTDRLFKQTDQLCS